MSSRLMSQPGRGPIFPQNQLGITLRPFGQRSDARISIRERKLQAQSKAPWTAEVVIGAKRHSQRLTCTGRVPCDGRLYARIAAGPHSTSSLPSVAQGRLFRPILAKGGIDYHVLTDALATTHYGKGPTSVGPIRSRR